MAQLARSHLIRKTVQALKDSQNTQTGTFGSVNIYVQHLNLATLSTLSSNKIYIYIYIKNNIKH